jgi:two-component system invasion response regulator UvrY
MRALVVDDHPAMRRSLGAVLTGAFPGSVVAGAEDGAAALRLVASERWDVVILDLSLPDRPGLQVLGEIRGLAPALPVLVMSLHPESAYGPPAMAAGATAYLVKGSDPAAIEAAVRRALSEP